MNREDITRMAREAGFASPDGPYITWGANDEQLERFAALIASHEREACAKVLDDWKKHNWTFEDCAKVVRARGQA